MLNLIIWLILIGVGLYLVGLIPMDATIKRIIQVLVIVVVILMVLQYFGLFTGLPISLRR